MNKYRIGQKKIENWLEEDGIKRLDNHERAILRKVGYRMTYEEVSDKIIDNYVNKKMGQIASGRELGLSDTQVKSILQKNNIPIRNFSEALVIRNKKYKKYDNNDNYFSTESSNMAYILGFIAADGTIRKKANSIKITLAKKDRELLDEIKEEIGIEAPVKEGVTNKGYDFATLSWTSQKHKEDLAKYSIIPQKTFALKPPINLKKRYWIDYIRGYFDGDGSINYMQQGALRWQVCSATPEILEFIIDYFHEEYDIPKVKVYKSNREENLYYFQYSTNATKKIFNFLYTPNSIFLKRKKDKYIEVLNLI